MASNYKVSENTAALIDLLKELDNLQSKYLDAYSAIFSKVPDDTVDSFIALYDIFKRDIAEAIYVNAVNEEPEL